MRLGVLGGTFDPVHTGHLVLAEQAREQLRLDRVLWVPAGDPWRKAGEPVSPAEHRLAMVRLAIERNDAFEVSTTELDRPGPTYTLDTLQQLHEEYAAEELIFLLGLDALADLPNWHKPAELIRLTLLYDLLLVAVLPFFFQGLAVLQHGAVKKRLNKFLTLLPYILLLLMPQFVIVGCACLGGVDMLFNFRKLPRTKS